MRPGAQHFCTPIAIIDVHIFTNKTEIQKEIGDYYKKNPKSIDILKKKW